MRKLSTYLKKAGISLMAAFTVFTNTNMGTLIAKAAEPQLNEGEELYQIVEGENTYTIREYTMDNSEVLFALRPETIYSADDQYEAYADDGVGTYLDDNNITSDQQEAIKKIISIGYGTEPNAGNYIASQVLIWQVVTGNTYEVDANVAANMETVQTKIAEYDTDPAFVGQDIILEGYGEDHAVTLEDASFTGYSEKEIPAGYHVEINDGSLKLWSDEGTEAGTLTFEKKSSEMKSILYKGTNGDFLSLGMEPKEISVNAKIEVPETTEEPKDEKVEEPEEAKAAKKAKAAKAAKAPVNNESVVAESVGDVRLIDISDVHVDYLKANDTTMTEGETFQTTSSSLSFIGRLKWKIPNSTDLTNIERVTYQLPKNIKLTEWSGDVTYRGEVVGTFEIDDSNMLFISYTDDFKKESNRAGWFKFETESMKNKSKEQDLLFESGEEYSFKLKGSDPPVPVTPKIGIEKEYNKISDLAISSNGETPYDIHFTVKVYSEKGVNNNVIVSDSYKWSRVPLDTQNGLYKVKVENKEGEVVFQQLFQNSLSWSSGNYVPFSWNSNGYEGEIGGLTPPVNPASLPTVKLNHLNDGDVLTIDYYINDVSDNKYFFAGNKSITNTATVVSDENPDSESDESYDFAKSNKRHLKQKDSVDVSRNPDGFVDKQVTVKDDTVHTEITINKNEEYTYFHRNLSLNLIDIPTNFSVEPSDDADYYLDKDSFKIELSALVYDGRKGNGSYAGNNYKREVVLTKTAEDLESLFNDSANADYLQCFFHGMMLSGGIITSSDYQSLLSPIVTISYDFKVNQDKFIACEKIEYSGSNTLTFDGGYDFEDPKTGEAYTFEKTVNYKNYVTPPSVTKKFSLRSTGNPMYAEEDGVTYLYWDLDIYVSSKGLTNLKVTDLPSRALTIDPTYRNGAGIWIQSDYTEHENPLVFDSATGEITISGSIKPTTALVDRYGRAIADSDRGHINVTIRTIAGDPTLDPNYTVNDDGTIEERYTNNATIDADEIINPCAKCPGCEEGHCNKRVVPETVINKSLENRNDNISNGNGGYLSHFWTAKIDFSNFIKDTDEIYIEDESLTENFVLQPDSSFNVYTLRSGDDTITLRKSNGSTVRFSDFFTVTQTGNKFKLQVKQEYIPQLKGNTLYVTYETKATSTSSSSAMQYKNKAVLYVNNEPVSESEVEDNYKVNPPVKLTKTAKTLEEIREGNNYLGPFGNYDNMGAWYNVRGQDENGDGIRIDKDYEGNVFWLIELDTSNIDPSVESITLDDYLIHDHSFYKPILEYTYVGALIGNNRKTGYVQYDGRGNKVDQYDPALNVEFNIQNNAGNFSYTYCKTESTTYNEGRDFRRISATLTKGSVLSNYSGTLGEYIKDSNITKLYMIVLCKYIPKAANIPDGATVYVPNKAAAYFNGSKVKDVEASKEMNLKPIEKEVVYNESTAPYAEYTVTLHPYGDTGPLDYDSIVNGRVLLFEDIPDPNLELLEDSVTVQAYWSWQANGSGGAYGEMDPNQFQYVYNPKISVDDNGKLSVRLRLNDQSTYGFDTMTYVIKYKAKVVVPEGETFTATNTAKWKPNKYISDYYTDTVSFIAVSDATAYSKSEYVLTDIFKKDAKTSAALEGAEFRIDKLTLNAEHTTVVKTETYGTPFTSGTDGHTDTVKLNYDTVYRIVETKTPDGYPTENKVTKYVVFPGHDNIDWANVSVDGIDYIEVIEPTIIDKNNKVSQTTVEVTNIKETSRKIVLTKKDDKGRILPNATFSLTGDDGSYTEYKTKEDGILEIINLVRGVTYTLAEKEAPQFYNKNENVITFTVSDKGEITSPTIQKYNVEYDGGKGTVTDGETTGDSINKEVDSGGNIALPEANAPEGYHFVYWTDENGNVVDNNTVVNQNMHVTAKYEHDVNSVTFVIPTGTMTYRENLNVTEFTRIVPTGGTLQSIPSVNVPTGYGVTGWYDENDNEVTTDTVVNDDMTVTAKVESYILQPGPTFGSSLTSGIKHVVFGNTADYESEISGVTGVNVDADNTGTIKSYTVGDTMYVLSDDTIYFNPDSKQMFLNSDCVLDSITFDNIDTSLATSLRSMFEGQTALTSLDLSDFDTLNVTSMSYMLKNCKALEDVDLSSFNTSNVQSMDQVFLNNYKLTDLDLSNFDTSSVTTMSQMFKGCTHLTELNVSSFNTRNVVRFDQMFFNVRSIDHLALSNFHGTSATHLQSMFSGCESLINLDLSSFETPVATSIGQMFYNCSALEYLDISGMDTTNNPSRTNMFTGTDALRKIKLGENWTAVSDSGFNDVEWYHKETTSVKVGSDLMSNYSGVDVGTWKINESVRLATGPQFNAIVKENCGNNGIYLRNIIFGELSDYKSEASLIEQRASNPSYADKYKKFNVSLNGLYELYAYYNDNTSTLYVLSDKIIKFNEDSSNMFANFYGLDSISFDNINTSSMTNTGRMFYQSLTSIDLLDLSAFDMSSVTSKSDMFRSDHNVPTAYGRTQADVDALNTSTGIQRNRKDNKYFSFVVKP